MARGLENHNKRKDALNSFGRDLVRRSGSKCELCGASGVSLEIFEVSPAGQEPEFRNCVFICATCSRGIETISKMNTEHWRCLTDKVWSEIPAVKILAVMILKTITPRAPWADEILDDVYLDEDEEVWISRGLI